MSWWNLGASCFIITFLKWLSFCWCQGKSNKWIMVWCYRNGLLDRTNNNNKLMQKLNLMQILVRILDPIRSSLCIWIRILVQISVCKYYIGNKCQYWELTDSSCTGSLESNGVVTLIFEHVCIRCWLIPAESMQNKLAYK